jgi:hypothetical protein
MKLDCSQVICGENNISANCIKRAALLNEIKPYAAININHLMETNN